VSALKLNHLALLVLFPAFLCGAAAGQQATESTHQVMTTAVYPNNSQGLVTLLNDALLAARNNAASASLMIKGNSVHPRTLSIFVVPLILVLVQIQQRAFRYGWKVRKWRHIFLQPTK
jgi:hypothetical protein